MLNYNRKKCCEKVVPSPILKVFPIANKNNNNNGNGQVVCSIGKVSSFICPFHF